MDKLQLQQVFGLCGVKKSADQYIQTKSLVDEKDANTALTSDEVKDLVNTISSSADSVATKIYQFQALKSNTEASVNAYKLALNNNTTTLSIKQIEREIQELVLQQAVIESELKALQSNNGTTITKWIVGGLVVVSVVGIFGLVMYNKKRQ